MIPVMVRSARGRYRVYGWYATFAEAADVVQALRRDPAVGWAYIPDDYAAAA